MVLCSMILFCMKLFRFLLLVTGHVFHTFLTVLGRFLKDLAFFISKVSEAHETTLHLLGGQLENEQGRQVWTLRLKEGWMGIA